MRISSPGKMRCRKHEDKYYWSLQADAVGKCLYIKDEPNYTNHSDYHEEPEHDSPDDMSNDSRSNDSFEEPNF